MTGKSCKNCEWNCARCWSSVHCEACSGFSKWKPKAVCTRTPWGSVIIGTEIEKYTSKDSIGVRLRTFRITQGEVSNEE